MGQSLVRVPIERRNDRGSLRRVAEHFGMTLPGHRDPVNPFATCPQTDLPEDAWTDVYIT